jgi:hypothetical protein
MSDRDEYLARAVYSAESAIRHMHRLSPKHPTLDPYDVHQAITRLQDAATFLREASAAQNAGAST